MNSADCCEEGNENSITKSINMERDQKITEVDSEDQVEDQLLLSATTFQVVDTFRFFYPLKEEAFTCWNVSTNSRSTNYGTRIDYIFCDEELLPHIKDSLVLQDIMGSDHCPVAVVVKGTIIPSSQVPFCCTKFFPEFRGQQQKLSSYFKPRCDSNECNKLPLLKSTQPSEMRNMAGNVPLNTAKRKNDISRTNPTDKKQCKEKQRSISSFFSVRANDSQSWKVTDSNETNHESQNSGDCRSTPNSLNYNNSCDSSSESSGSSQDDSCLHSQNSKESNKEVPVKSNQTKNQGWGFLMKGPKPPPLCPGHKEPCVLQTVKKKGPNINRQFYACARGVGKEGDPNARCNFFKWAK